MAFTETRELPWENSGYYQYAAGSLATAQPIKGSGTAALIQAEAQSVRYRGDGVDPTSTVGMLISPGECVWYTGDLTKLRFIQVSAGAILNIHVFK